MRKHAVVGKAPDVDSYGELTWWTTPRSRTTQSFIRDGETLSVDPTGLLARSPPSSIRTEFHTLFCGQFSDLPCAGFPIQR